MLPPEIKMSKEAQDLVQQCCQGVCPRRRKERGADRLGRAALCSLEVRCDIQPCVFASAEYIHLLGSEANEICEGEQRNMVQPDDVLRAIQVR
eukprot:scaffold4969_cov364-Prasinococcus_capsulatus_cf.AAC.6